MRARSGTPYRVSRLRGRRRPGVHFDADDREPDGEPASMQLLEAFVAGRDEFARNASADDQVRELVGVSASRLRRAIRAHFADATSRTDRNRRSS